MHVDMDAFFASIEQLDHPEYKGHPVIVGGLSSRGVVATCSYEARKFGVHSAMPISRAKKLCPDGIYVYPRMDRYKEVSHQIFSIMKEFTPYIEPLSIDEAFLEVSGMSTMYSGPKALGRAIKDRVYEQTTIINESKGAIQMEKVLNIEGMVCMNCVKHVDKALREIQGIKDVAVHLESKSAQVQMSQDVPDDVLKTAIEDAGYQLVSIQ